MRYGRSARDRARSAAALAEAGLRAMLADIVTDAMAVAVVQIPKLEPLALRGVATGRVDDNLLLLGVFEFLCYAAAMQ